MLETFPKDLEDVHAYINIKKSRIHNITCKYPVTPCDEVIEWIVTHMDDSQLVLCSESGKHLATYYGEDMQTYYKMLKPNKYANDSFYKIQDNLDTNNVIK